jgi:DNA modification methylase
VLNRIIQGDALTVLKTLPDESVNCCVTSPPYWQQRNYGVDGQIGMERTPQEYVSRLLEVFGEVRRILKTDGSLWLNVGDKYLSAKGTAHNPGGRVGPNQCFHSNHKDANAIPLWRPNISDARALGIKHKDLVGIPWMLAFALRSNGWWLRARCPWIKRNPTPESTEDRPTVAIEDVFLLTKSERYFYDHKAVKMPCQSGPSDIKKMIEGKERIGGKHKVLVDKFSKASSATNMGRKRSVGDPTGRARKNSDWFFESWEGLLTDEDGDPLAFVVNTEPFRESHFAVMPKTLVEPMIKAGCPEGGVVLDPFMGAGTVAMVAKKLQRNYIGIELNPEYVVMAEKRIERECGGLF